MKIRLPLLAVLLIAGCTAERTPEAASEPLTPSPTTTDAAMTTEPPLDKEPADRVELATFAGGCFWCVEAPFEKLPGVLSAVSGYTGGHVENPTYRQIGTGTTGHTEAVQITFDPAVTSYAELVEYFWRLFDPTDAGGSFVDRGSQYRSAIFTHSDEQKRIAEASKNALESSGRFDLTIVTEIVPLDVFYPAEEYHQNYYKKSAAHYERYRRGSGRDQFLDRVWGDEK